VVVGLLADPARRTRVSTWLKPALGFALAGCLTILLYAPLLFEVERSLASEAPEPQVATGIAWAVLEVLKQLGIGVAMSVAGVLGGVLFVAGCWSFLRQSRTLLTLMLLPGPVTVAAALILERPIRPRFLLFLAGFVLLIVVRGAVVVGQWATQTLAPALSPRVVPIGLVVAMALASVLALPHGYRYPKQDYEGALQYVEGMAGEAPIVLAGGGTAVPYQRYHGRAWKRLDGAPDLEALLRDHRSVWLLYTFPRYIEVLEPELMEGIRTSCSRARTFRGTVGGGDINVLTCKAG
jgi:hypothetical protein